MLYTVEEVARILKVSTATVRKIIKNGELATVQVGKRLRITQKALDEYLERKA